MAILKAAATILALTLVSGCVATDRPTTKTVKLSVEEQKIEVARLRDRGQISYEEAARRQFEIQRGNYALTEGEFSFWRASIEYARQVDEKRISVAEYRRLVAAAHARYVAKQA